MKFRKKPVVIDAFQWNEDVKSLMAWTQSIEPVSSDCLIRFDVVRGLVINTKEGEMLASVGDWIIRGVRGELYPCKPDIFNATYDPA